MSLQVDDTIAAIASAPGGAARGIVRLSGPAAIECLATAFTADNGKHLNSVRKTSLIAGQFDLGGHCGRVPALAYLWPTTRSYTRQIAAELHLPGSPPLLEAALATVVGHGARIARPGEFTLRAFLAGRLDLTQAEAVLGVIDAESASQLHTALGQLAGGLAGPLHALRGELLDLLAHLEAGLDFVEEDIEFITQAELTQQLNNAADRVTAIAQQMQSRGEASDQPRVVLIGLPNAGKSSLLNALAGESAAIVSEIAGTTRDYVFRTLELSGVRCLLVDTAGIESPGDPHSIAAAAQAMTGKQSGQSELTLLCLDVTQPRAAWELDQVARADDRQLVVYTKCDAGARIACKADLPSVAIHCTSSKTGHGLAELKASIAERLQAGAADTSVVAGTAARCRESLMLAAQSLARARDAAVARLGEELVAAEVRSALDDLGRVVGAIYTDDVLDRIFSRFCIGK